MACLDHKGLGQSLRVETALLLRYSVGIELWQLQGDDGADIKCCFWGRENPTMNHMMGCEKQHLHGHNAVHTGQQRYCVCIICCGLCVVFDVMRYGMRTGRCSLCLKESKSFRKLTLLSLCEV